MKRHTERVQLRADAEFLEAVELLKEHYRQGRHKLELSSSEVIRRAVLAAASELPKRSARRPR
jgi:superfamily I DNA and/or RNA helicase